MALMRSAKAPYGGEWPVDAARAKKGKSQIRIDRENQTCHISDNGIGMSRDES